MKPRTPTDPPDSPDTLETLAPLDALFAEARSSLPFGEAGGFGFAARLRARLREEGSPSLGDWIALLSWRFTAAALPLLALAAAASGLSGSDLSALPEGVGGVVAQWALYLPLELP